MGQTFVEKVLGAPAGAIVFRKPDIVLTHDNTSSIFSTFKKMGAEKIFDPNQCVVVLDHNAPPTDSKLATQYQASISIETAGFSNIRPDICCSKYSHTALNSRMNTPSFRAEQIIPCSQADRDVRDSRVRFFDFQN